MTSFGIAVGREKEWGMSESPPNSTSVAGSYYCGDGLGHNVLVTLEHDGTYTATLHGCLGLYGMASGQWTLKEDRIALMASKEVGEVKLKLKSLDVLKFKGQWIFVDADSREFYNEFGVLRSSCFQQQKKSPGKRRSIPATR